MISLFRYLENTEKGVDDGYQWNYFYPMVLENLSIDTVWVSASPEDYEALVRNKKFQEVLKMNLFIRNFQQDQYEEIQKIVVGLIAQIDRHLAHLNE